MSTKLGCGLVALLGACSSGTSTLPDGYDGPQAPADASMQDDADFDNVDPDERPTMPPLSQGGEAVDPCALGSTIGTGIMSGTLAGGSGEPALTQRATLDRFPDALPGIFQGLALPVPSRLTLRRDGLFATSENGFFDVDRDHTARFHLVDTVWMVHVLSIELDDDDDEDAISLHLGATGENEESPFAIVWEREADGRLERRARFVTRADHTHLASTLADYDGDGDADVITADDEGRLHALRNDDGFELAHVALQVGDVEHARVIPVALHAEDRNRDGAVDILALVDLPDELMKVLVYLNDGAGAFASPVVSDLSRSGAVQARFGDVTGDGLADLVVYNLTVNVARSLDATHFDGSSHVADGSGFTLADIDADTLLDIAVFGGEGLQVFLARDRLESARVTFDVASSGLNAIAIESATDEPARLHALYHASCRPPCDDACDGRCIFEACVECIAHSDCGAGKACKDLLCVPR